MPLLIIKFRLLHRFHRNYSVSITLLSFFNDNVIALVMLVRFILLISL